MGVGTTPVPMTRRRSGPRRTLGFGIYSDTMRVRMDAAGLLRTARHTAGLTLRELGALAGTSHSTLAAYESGRTVPNVATLDRVLRAAGFDADVELRRRHRSSDGVDRGEELVAVLELAAAFPARHAERLDAPVFGRS